MHFYDRPNLQYTMATLASAQVYLDPGEMHFVYLPAPALRTADLRSTKGRRASVVRYPRLVDRKLLESRACIFKMTDKVHLEAYVEKRLLLGEVPRHRVQLGPILTLFLLGTHEPHKTSFHVVVQSIDSHIVFQTHILYSMIAIKYKYWAKPMSQSRRQCKQIDVISISLGPYLAHA